MTGPAGDDIRTEMAHRPDVQFAFHDIGLDWPAALNPRQNLAAMIKSVKPMLAVPGGIGPATGLAAETPTLDRNPTYEATLDSVLHTRPPERPEELVPDADAEQPRRRSRGGDQPMGQERRYRKRNPRLAKSATTPSPDPGQQTEVSAAGPIADRKPAVRPADRPNPAADAARLPAKMSDHRLAARTGQPPSSMRSAEASVASQPSRAASLPTASEHRSAKSVSPMLPHPFDRQDPTERSRSEEFSDRSRAAVAKRLGLTDATALAHALNVVPGTGDRADMDRLVRHCDSLAGRTSSANGPVDRSATKQPPAGRTHHADPAVADDHQSQDETHHRVVTPGHIGHDQAHNRPGTAVDRPASVATPTPGRGEVTPLRHVTSHDEMPLLPDRERATAPAVRHQADDESPPSPLTEQLHLPSEDRPVGIDRHELERQMKSILDEAARRHGIEL